MCTRGAIRGPSLIDWCSRYPIARRGSRTSPEQEAISLAMLVA
jgi:hypothetical protein